MDSDAPALEIDRPACAWPDCRAVPAVRLKYAPIASALVLPRGLQLAPQGGALTLCDAHSEQLEAALGPGRIMRLTWLG